MSNHEERQESYRKVAGTVFAAAVLLLSFLIIKPFVVAMFSGAALAYIFNPLFLRLQKILPAKPFFKRVASMLTCLFIILLVLVPAVFISTVLAFEIREGFNFLNQNLGFFELSNGALSPLMNWANRHLAQIKDLGSNFTDDFIDAAKAFFKAVPQVLINILVAVFCVYYFLIHSKEIYRFFSELIPLPEERYRQILKRFDNLSRGVILGQVAVGLVQGVLAGLGFFFLGVPNPVLWGSLTAIISIIPLLGAAMVWVPVDIYLLIMAIFNGEYWKALFLFAYGFCVISFVDNLLKPKIVGDTANIHPLVILLGILGGIQLFGLPGIIIGPLILTIFDVVIETYKEMI